MEHLAAVKTARRERRTDIAATSAGALREARKPCEGRPRRGDARAEQPWWHRNPWRGDGGLAASRQLGARVKR
jgi:hypothetical protein